MNKFYYIISIRLKEINYDYCKFIYRWYQISAVISIFEGHQYLLVAHPKKAIFYFKKISTIDMYSISCLFLTNLNLLHTPAQNLRSKRFIVCSSILSNDPIQHTSICDYLAESTPLLHLQLWLFIINIELNTISHARYSKDA